MAFEQKTWKDRVTEFPNRRILTDTDNNDTIVTVTRNEGNISQEGDPFSASTMNNLEQRIADAFEEQDASFQAGVDAVYAVTVEKGSTPTSKSLSDVVAAIRAIKTQVDSMPSILNQTLFNGHNTSISGSPSFNTEQYEVFIACIAIELEDKYLTGATITTVNGTKSFMYRFGNSYIFLIKSEPNKTVTINYSFSFSSNDSDAGNLIVCALA